MKRLFCFTISASVLLLFVLINPHKVRAVDQWIQQTSGTTEELRGVWAYDDTHVWAVGETGVMLFYDGNSWSSQDTGTSCIRLNGIYGLNPNNVWAVGLNTDVKGVVLYYNGTSWTNIYTSAAVGEQYYNVYALDASLVWVVGNNNVMGQNMIFYNGSSWSSNLIPSELRTTYSLYAVYASDILNVFTSGGDGHVFYYNGLDWTRYDDVGGSGSYIYDLGGTDSSHIWGINYYSSGHVFFHDGSWDVIPEGASPTWIDHDGGHGIDVLDSTHIYFAGYGGGSKRISMYDGSSWFLLYNSSGGMFEDIDMISTSRGWAVGSSGIIYMFQEDTTLPTGSILIDSGSTYTNNGTVALSLSSTDVDDETDTLEMMIGNDQLFSRETTGWISYSASMSWDLEDGSDGVRTVYVKYRDPKENESEVYSDTIILDRIVDGTITKINGEEGDGGEWSTRDTKPLIEGNGEAGSMVCIEIHSEGGETSCFEVGEDGSWSYQVQNELDEGEHVITFTITDEAGNTRQGEYVLRIMGVAETGLNVTFYMVVGLSFIMLVILGKFEILNFKLPVCRQGGQTNPKFKLFKF